MTIHSASTEATIVVSLAATNFGKAFTLPWQVGKPVLMSSGTITGTWVLEVYCGPDGRTTIPTTSPNWGATGVEIDATNQVKKFDGIIGAFYRFTGGTQTSGVISIRCMTE